MKKFYGNDFFLHTDTAKELYNEIKTLPIYDYHCHMTAKDIFDDNVFENIGQLWLGGDHYKWRAMRQCGIPERYITGDASWKDKFCEFASILPLLGNNPLYHWAHLELKSVFGVIEPLNSRSAERIYDACNRVIYEKQLSPRKMLELFHVEVVCTTDDPADDLAYHKKIKGVIDTKVLPAFRPDMICTGIEKSNFVDYCTKLGVNSFDSLLKMLESKLDYFVSCGCKVADHGISYPPKTYGSREDASVIFEKRISGKAVTSEEAEKYSDFMLRFFINLYAEKDIVMQMHMSPLRNINDKAFALLGADSGIDTVGDAISAENLSRILNTANNFGSLPKIIFYSLNDSEDSMIASVIGAFAGDVRGKMQLGAAWWFNDHRLGIEKQLNTYSSILPIGNFVGMLTDSRSYTSYCRFDYFRRILCDLLGKWVENGELDAASAKLIAQNVGYDNAKEFFGM